MIITRHEIEHSDITEFITEGHVDVEEVINVFKNEYGTVSRLVLWDTSEGGMSDMTSKEMTRIANAAKQYSVHEKTAFVGESPFVFGMMRMYEAHAEMAGVPLKMAVFHDRGEAIKWLKDEGTT